MTAHIGPLRFGSWNVSARGRRGLGYGIGRLIWGTAMAVSLILLIGIALTWWNANPANDIAHAFLRAGAWLATPFHDAFTGGSPRARLTEDWLLAAGVYLAAGRVLAWVIGR